MNNKISLIAIVLILIGLISYLFLNNNISPAKESIKPTTEETYSDSDTESYKTPKIISLSRYQGPIGTKIKIHGDNLVDAKGNQNIVIENSKGEKAFMGFGDGEEITDIDGKFIKWDNLAVTIYERTCKDRVTDAGLPCKSWMNITPGKYKIYIDHKNTEGHYESNKVEFTITNDTDSQ